MPALPFLESQREKMVVDESAASEVMIEELFLLLCRVNPVSVGPQRHINSVPQVRGIRSPAGIYTANNHTGFHPGIEMPIPASSS